VHPAEEGGFWAEVPSLPGCVTEGETLDELRANLHEAVAAWVEAGSPESPVGAGDHFLELRFEAGQR
jgi:predicted RNase H-like HicB family nuclease